MKDNALVLNALFLGVISLLVLAVIAATAYRFWFKKEYLFTVEASCDPVAQTCFYRSCFEEGDYCPPNELEYYRVFVLSAADFVSCTDNTCLVECTSGVISCEERICGESEDDECANAPPESQNDGLGDETGGEAVSDHTETSERNTE